MFSLLTDVLYSLSFFRPPTYVEEQENLKDEIIKVGAGIDEESDEEGKIGGLLELRQKCKEEKTTESEHIKWLAGQTEDLQDDETKSELKPLKDFWNDPNLDNGEKFLRDYVLNKRFALTSFCYNNYCEFLTDI